MQSVSPVQAQTTVTAVIEADGANVDRFVFGLSTEVTIPEPGRYVLSVGMGLTCVECGEKVTVGAPVKVGGLLDLAEFARTHRC